MAKGGYLCFCETAMKEVIQLSRKYLSRSLEKEKKK